MKILLHLYCEYFQSSAGSESSSVPCADCPTPSTSRSIETTSTSSRPKTSKPPKQTDTDSDQMLVEGIQLAIDSLKESKNDECQIFGNFVAGEVRRLTKDFLRQQLKRAIQRTIMDFNEKVFFAIYISLFPMSIDFFFFFEG